MPDRIVTNQTPDPVLKNIEAIVGLQARYDEKVPSHQRILEKTAASFGEPAFLYGMLIFFICWHAGTYLGNIGIISWDLPKFDLRQDWLDLASLLISTGVLAYQTRQGKLSEQRSHLVLQLNILTEQKIAKLIALVEELRIDLPNVRNRYDSEAERMQQVVDPIMVLDVLQEALNPATVGDGPEPL
jgi:uncharacterized membrane protein